MRNAPAVLLGIVQSDEFRSPDGLGSVGFQSQTFWIPWFALAQHAQLGPAFRP